MYTAIVVALLAFILVTPVHAQVQVNIGIELPAPPPLVVVPGFKTGQRPQRQRAPANGTPSRRRSRHREIKGATSETSSTGSEPDGVPNERRWPSGTRS